MKHLPEVLVEGRAAKRCPTCGKRYRLTPVVNEARSALTGAKVWGWGWEPLDPPPRRTKADEVMERIDARLSALSNNLSSCTHQEPPDEGGTGVR